MQQFKLIIGKNDGPYHVIADGVLSSFSAKGSVVMELDAEAVKNLFAFVYTSGCVDIQLIPSIDLPSITVRVSGSDGMVLDVDANLTFEASFEDSEHLELVLDTEAGELSNARFRLLGEIDDLTWADLDDWPMFVFDYVIL